ncbi:MAG: prepilin-type N-terminal cleavage/methylation domain-containing protein [Cetobacterium sp.]|uniref:prepilin-type N-terminal cleavage/methylation domain-containing protein n=1 Tax=Cetobacterium sp. TaxID=2071632 RepID=UPI003F3C1662
MYINKNKGFSLIEVMSTLLIITIILQTLYSYLKYVNSENKIILKKLEKKLNVEPIFKGMDKSIYESKTYKIYNLSSISKLIDYSKPSLMEGNTLIIEKYSPFNEDSEIEIYYQVNLTNYVEVFYAKKNTKDIILNIESGEIILKSIKTTFYIEDFGVKVKGNYKNESYKYELKK